MGEDELPYLQSTLAETLEYLICAELGHGSIVLGALSIHFQEYPKQQAPSYQRFSLQI